MEKWKNLKEKSVWKFPRLVAVRWQRDGPINVTCVKVGSHFSHLLGADDCLTIDRELTRCSLFLLNHYTLFLQNITCFAAPGSPVAAAWCHRLRHGTGGPLFAVHICKREKKSGSNETLIQKGRRLRSRIFGCTYGTALNQENWKDRWFTPVMMKQHWGNDTEPLPFDKSCVVVYRKPGHLKHPIPLYFVPQNM